VPGDVPFVPGQQDRVDVAEVLVQGRATDAGVLGDAHMVTEVRPCAATNAAVVSRMRHAPRGECASIVRFHSFGTVPV